MARNFNRAHDFRIDNFQVFHGHSVGNPLEKLEAVIAPEALDDSAERCDAPKCHPKTRIAVQDNLYSWIEHGDPVNPKNMKWVTGPAGTGKTAVMGSVTERCKENGISVACFFFSSTGSIGRRTKTAFVTTIAHQLAQHRQDLKDAITSAIEADTVVFKKNLRVQMETLVLAPLRAVAEASDTALRGVIVIDGLDECQVGEVYEDATTGPRTKPRRTKEADQLEILQVLHQAASDPSFPYRILIASRPERVFREFFDPDTGPGPVVAETLDLNVQYNADDDIALFLKAHFDRIRRRYCYALSWPSPEVIEILVKNASGQFVYAATVIRILNESAQREPPKALLEAILTVKATTVSSDPLEQLHALYTHILESSPDSHLAELWFYFINRAILFKNAYASDVDLFLQMEPESGEAKHLLENLHSLIWVPPSDKHATSQYSFYHKSLLDFIESRLREEEVNDLVWDRFLRACARGCDDQYPFSEAFLNFLVEVPDWQSYSFLQSTKSELVLTPARADWWVSLAMACKAYKSFIVIFLHPHDEFRCDCASDDGRSKCSIWSRSMFPRLGSSCALWSKRDQGLVYKFSHLVRKAMGIEKTESKAAGTDADPSTSSSTPRHAEKKTLSMGAAGTDAKTLSEPKTRRRRGQKVVSGAAGTAAETSVSSSSKPKAKRRRGKKTGSGAADASTSLLKPKTRRKHES